MMFAATPVRETPSDGLLVRDPNGLSNQTVLPEAKLRIESIQGLVLTGFNKDFRQLISLRVSVDTPSRLKAFKTWLREESKHVATAAEVIAFNRLFKATRDRRGGEGTVKSTWLAVALGQKLLTTLTNGNAKFADKAFTQGLAKRSPGLNDPTGNHAFAPSNWVVGGDHNEADILFIVEADDKADLDAHADRLNQSIGELNHTHPKIMEIIFIDEGANLPPPLSGHEHFGFLDGISQPGIRGLLSDEKSDPLTYRQNPNNRDQVKDKLVQAAQGKPGQDLLHPGEFIFGYPRQIPTPDEGADGPNPHPGEDSLNSFPAQDGTLVKQKAGPEWAADGSFLVYRRLRQDVGAFHKFLFDTAKQVLVAALPNDSGARYVGSQLVGRWPSGCPVLRGNLADDRSIGNDDSANNHFEFGGASDPIARDKKDPDRAVDQHKPASQGDTDGAKCPFNAHIRKSYPRDDEAINKQPTDRLNESDTQTHRLLRRGLPYGPISNSSFDSPDPSGDDIDRGLQFLCFQTSIENQFEFVIQQWVNDVNFKEPFAAKQTGKPAEQGGGLDPILGQRAANVGERKFNIIVPDGTGKLVAKAVTTPHDWVHPTGGGYFFTPSLAALNGELTA